MTTLIRRFLNSESGATAIEYGLIIAMIFLAIIGSVQLFANNSNGALNQAMATIAAAL
jgi:pilus assembly protein Flp/PilA